MKKSGFTLIELLVAIAVVAVLAAGAFAVFHKGDNRVVLDENGAVVMNIPPYDAAAAKAAKDADQDAAKAAETAVAESKSWQQLDVSALMTPDGASATPGRLVIAGGSTGCPITNGLEAQVGNTWIPVTTKVISPRTVVPGVSEATLPQGTVRLRFKTATMQAEAPDPATPGKTKVVNIPLPGGVQMAAIKPPSAG